MRVTSGRLLVATGLLHQAVGVAVGARLAVDGVERNVLRELVVDGAGTDFVRLAWFWFLITGFVLLVLGDLAHRLERQGVALPASLGWQLGALGVVGVLAIPASGFWLLLPQAWWIVRRARRR